MYTQQTPIAPSFVLVTFQAAEVASVNGGIRVVPGTSVISTVAVPADRMASHLECHIAEQYPGLTLVDWEIQ